MINGDGATAYRKDFRRKVLQLHYDLSSGNSWVLVFRQQVAEHLGITDGEDFKLLGAITYLEEKGFLKLADNMREQITGLGIDEVEGDFPTLSASSSTILEPGGVDEEILKLTPELYGVGLNLKALWRKFAIASGKSKLGAIKKGGG